MNGDSYTVRGVEFKFKHSEYLFDKPKESEESISFHYDYRFWLDTQDQKIYNLTVLLYKSQVSRRTEIVAKDSSKSLIRRSAEILSDPKDDKIQNYFKLYEGQTYKFTFRTTLGISEPQTHQVKFSIKLPS